MTVANRNAAEMDPSNIKELRIALVCYGGVSLAIYMHGVTKEIHKLVLASAAFEQDSTVNPFPPTVPEHAYWQALRERADEDRGVHTRVLVDVIAGTSAGGINGIVLAKALAGNRPQDALRDLWLDNGDIKKLMNLPWVPGVWGKATTWLVSRQLLPNLLRRLPLVGQVVSPKPPLDGDLMFKLVHTALEKMDVPTTGNGARRASLLPDGHVLELFVTTTDVNGYDRLVYLYDPRQVKDPAHRHLLTFRYGEGQDCFDRRYNAFLAFAARATSCFPGAFAPINLANIRKNVPDWKPENVESEFFAIYKASAAEPGKTYFIDGGVLDNYPFHSAIDAILRRPAAYEVDRRLIYIEPDPVGALVPPDDEQPSWLSTIWAGLSRLPREEPILDDLLAVRRHNARVEQVQSVVRAAFERVAAQVIGDAPTSADLTALFKSGNQGWRDDMNLRAAELCGPAYIAYARLKLRGVVETFAGIAAALCGYPVDSNQTFFIHDVLVRWGRQRADVLGEEDFTELNAGQKAFLRTFDLGYSQRRIRFAIRGINTLYAHVEDDDLPPNRAHLNAAKQKLYELDGQLDALISGRGVATAKSPVESIFGGGEVEKALAGPGDLDEAVDTFVAPKARALDDLMETARSMIDQQLEGFGDRLHRTVADIVSNWKWDAVREVLIRYLGFPLWDALVYPMIKLTDTGELQRIDVVRMSPNDSLLLSTEGRNKLEGVKMYHFGAFFSRKARENDYLWGRLDAAERLLRMLRGDAAHPLCKAAFKAILEEDRGVLRKIPNMISDLEGRTEAL